MVARAKSVRPEHLFFCFFPKVPKHHCNVTLNQPYIWHGNQVAPFASGKKRLHLGLGSGNPSGALVSFVEKKVQQELRSALLDF